ncbi:hypothetical protein [Alkalihalobacillus sp. 1P02AB]|uniref:hypothetical protein n=1 Tax=Alkalihalobacillus sp. 1P02AB TaxID=3132260 RepID=UPI0039A46187
MKRILVTLLLSFFIFHITGCSNDAPPKSDDTPAEEINQIKYEEISLPYTEDFINKEFKLNPVNLLINYITFLEVDIHESEVNEFGQTIVDTILVDVTLTTENKDIHFSNDYFRVETSTGEIIDSPHDTLSNHISMDNFHNLTAQEEQRVTLLFPLESDITTIEWFNVYITSPKDKETNEPHDTSIKLHIKVE